MDLVPFICFDSSCSAVSVRGFGCTNSKRAPFLETQEPGLHLNANTLRAGATSKKQPQIIKTFHRRFLEKTHNRGGNILLVFF